MPRLSDMMQGSTVIGNVTFEYSAARPEELAETEYTLVGLACDISSSVHSYAQELVDAQHHIINACGKHDRGENLLVRSSTFNHQSSEVHGFKPIADIDLASDYPALSPRGSTALFDATYDMLGAVLQYGEQLADADIDVNAIIFIITDGDDNSSSVSMSDIKNLIEKCRKSEKISSVTTVLIGINDSSCAHFLQNFQQQANLDHYISVGDASASKLAKLAKWISKSISTTSTSLSSGGSTPSLDSLSF